MKTKKKTLALALLLLPTAMAWAGNVSEAEALKMAQQFLDKRGTGATIQPKMAAKGPRRAVATAAPSDYYVFNVGSNDGFVIVSGDDRTVDILGYADSGTFDQENVPDGLRYLLDGYAEQMAWLDARQVKRTAASSASSPARSPIAPLIASHWDQGAPYNNLCPEINGEKTVTGCVATSMAQLMYYHQWPAGSSEAVPGYTTSTAKIVQDDLVPTQFGWSSMTTTYSSDAVGTAADEVAKLMKYCGWALNMDYGTDASSAYSEAIPDALKTYFGYDGGVRHAYRRCYSYMEWVDLIYSELANNRPVALGGQSMGGGHSFVCDGYDTDDYFHINWGWGGDSDGYFRLSLLNPNEQGIGGSSTLDGFSFSQGAVIGIQPPVDGNKDYCLSLEGLYPASTSYTRNSGEAFSGIGLYFLVYNYHYGTNSYDYAVQLVDGDNNLVHQLHNATQTMTWNQQNTTKLLTGLSIPSTVADGTYYIKVMSRPTGASAWQECFDGDRYQLTAVISGDQLTIRVPIPATVLPTKVDFSVSSDLTQGHEQEVTASITGGAADYHGNVILGVKGPGEEKFKAVMGKVLDIPADQTVDAHFTFIPSVAGEITLALYSGMSDGYVSGNQIGKAASITISASDATDNLPLAFTYAIENQASSEKLYGNAFHATITVTNPSSANSYAGSMNCSVRKWTSTITDNGDNTYSLSTGWESVSLTSYPLVVDKEGSASVKVAIDGLEPTDKYTRYSVRITYRNTSEQGKVSDGIHIGLDTHPLTTELEYGTLEIVGGYALGDATGATTLHELTGSIDAADACFVDLRSLTSLEGVTFSNTGTNPNCVYLLPDGASAPTALSGRNVVVGSSASSLTLTDGYDFFTPIAFTAADATYTRTFTASAAGTSGWNTLFLPFTATSVTCEGLGTVDWFQSATDEAGNFWLRNFVTDSDASVGFDYTGETYIAALTPYIIAVPGADFGSWQMTGKTVTFKGSGVSIAASTTAAPGVSGNHYKFCGNTVGSTVSDVYLLNAAGSKFVKSSGAVEPFRAWFSPVSISSLSRASLSIASPEATAIRLTPSSEGTEDDCYFTLDGRRLPAAPTAPGVYVKNRKKVIIK